MTASGVQTGEHPLIADRARAVQFAAVMAAIAVLVSIGMALEGSANWIQSIDDQVYLFVVTHEVGALAWLGRFLGDFGSVVVMAPLMIGVAVFLGVKHRWSALTVWITAIAVSQLISITMKNLYARPRPPLPLMETSSFSFPSGHAITGAVFALGLMIVLVPPGRRRPLYWTFAVVYMVAMAWSRVYVRAHWLSDVTAGVAIGSAMLMITALVVVWLDDKQQDVSGVDG